MDLALRKSYRTQLTKMVNSMNGVLTDESTTLDDVAVLCERIKAVHLSLKELNEKLATTFKEDQIESECEKIVEYDLAATEAVARLERRITSEERVQRQLQQDLTEAREEDGKKSNLQQGNLQNINQHTQVRLPKLEIMKFNGDIALWPEFWEQYSSAVHNNKCLDNTSKFAYLKSYLTGKATVTVSGLTSSKDSYEDAIELLKAEYGCSDRIIDTYIQKLLSISHVKHDKDTFALRRLFNSASTITRSLKTLGISADQYGLLVKSIIYKALPYNMRIAFNKQKISNPDFIDNVSVSGASKASAASCEVGDKNYEKQIDGLLNFIKVELDSIEQARILSDVENRDKEGSGRKRRPWEKKPGEKDSETFSAAGLLASAKDCCLFCKSKWHKSIDCNSSLSVAAKKDILKQNRLCFRCIRPNHNSRFCKTKDINCAKCKKRHATAMCEIRDSNSEPKSDDANSSSNPNGKNTTALVANSIFNNIYLKTACAFILPYNNNKMTLVRMIVDGGSQLSFIREDISRQLNLPVIGKHKIAIQSFGQSEMAPARLCNRVKLKLRSQYTDAVIEVTAVEVPEICFDTLNPPSESDPIINKFSLNHYLADSVNGPQQPINGISLLVGADNYWKIVSQETIKLTDNLTAIKTVFCWTIHGASLASDNKTDTYIANFNSFMVLHAQAQSSVNNELDLKMFWDLETIGINTNDSGVLSNFTSDFMKNNVTFDKCRYQVTLPWRSDKILDSNYTGALVRAKGLVRKFCKNGTLTEYDAAVREYIRSGCAEEVSNNDNSNNERAYYMPHRPVYRNDKETTKLRVVFDASAHAPGALSLNEKLFAGENLVPDILKILVNFRIGAVALIADIEKAFLQIRLNEEDRNYHRFLWFKEPIEKNLTPLSELPDFTKFCMTRVTFRVTTSPFLLAVTLRKHLMMSSEREIADILLKSFYVDDLVLAVESTSRAVELYEKAKIILSEASMNLRKWCSNDQTLMNLFSESEQRAASESHKKVLGILWFPITDELAIDLNSIFSESPDIITKRSVLQTIAKIFDPIGILGPLTVKAKIILQDIWKRKLDWDDELPEDVNKQWKKWQREISKIGNYSISRCLIGNPSEEVELHIFADASPQAYGCVAYLKNLTTKECKFILSKNRVAPLNEKEDKALTLPKLELTACLCAARLGKYLVESVTLNSKNIIFWSDSKIALYWINGRNSKWKPYVQNRVSEIHNIQIGSWKHCPGKCNPADLITRGVQSATSFTESRVWLEGPSWLSECRENWPKDEELVDSEIKVLTCFVSTKEKLNPKTQPMFSMDRFSNFDKMLRITAYVRRFLNNANKSNKKRSGHLLSSEIIEAENYWLRLVHEKEFARELHDLQNGKPVSTNSSIATLRPFLDDTNLLRLGGRLQEACLSEEERHPVILPKSSPITTKIICDAHNQILHSGVGATLAETRKKYWIIQGRQKVKSIIGRCLRCKRFKGKAGSEPFAPLPKDRVTLARPFDVTGVDFAGPLYIFQDSGDRKKTYIMLFTCAAVRAVHLKLVMDLTTESCVRGLRRFIARRGVPRTIYSDNAKTFKRTSNELHRLSATLEEPEVQDLALKQRIEWKFIVERASWWGGFWERLVRTVKNGLKITLGRRLLTQDELQTILLEVEMAVNSRPLTYIDNDPTNITMLSPANFLIGPKNLGLDFYANAKEVKRDDILKLWGQREKLAKQFWRRWTQDYLQQLRSAHHMKNFKSNSFKVGDVALLHDQNRPRLTWKLVRVTECFQGRDGRVRSCEIETSEKTRMRRPVQLLYPLEIDNYPPGEDVENPAE